MYLSPCVLLCVCVATRLNRVPAAIAPDVVASETSRPLVHAAERLTRATSGDADEFHATRRERQLFGDVLERYRRDACVEKEHERMSNR